MVVLDCGHGSCRDVDISLVGGVGPVMAVAGVGDGGCAESLLESAAKETRRNRSYLPGNHHGTVDGRDSV